MTRIASTAAAGRVSALRRRARYIPASISAPMITINRVTGANIGCALLLSMHPMRADKWRHLVQADHRAAWSMQDNYRQIPSFDAALRGQLCGANSAEHSVGKESGSPGGHR